MYDSYWTVPKDAIGKLEQVETHEKNSEKESGYPREVEQSLVIRYHKL